MSRRHRQSQTTGDLFPEPHAEPGAPARDEVLVAVARPVATLLSYAVPPGLEGRLRPGQHVVVPLGGARAPGFVVELRSGTAGPSLKPVLALRAVEPVLTRATLELGLWVAEHYGAAPGEALQAVVPAPVRHQRSGRTEPVAALRDAPAARRALADHAGSPAWLPRLRVLRALLHEPAPVPVRELAGRLRVSDSPVRTLARAGIVRVDHVAVGTDPFARLEPDRRPPPQLTPPQRHALKELSALLATRRAHAALLHGVTGSGKTEVYLRLIAETLAQGRGAILLVPEIALTPQTVERLLGRIPDIAVLHSNQSEAERARQWVRLRSGAVRVAVGPRSAVFAPIPHVGLIVIDEEHETTFKQQSSPRYHARDVARRRADIEGALLLLGTATPSMEAEAACRTSGVRRLSLPERVEGRPLPDCTVLDMRHQPAAGPGRVFSRPLILAIEETLDRGEQVLLFLNRRGFSTSVLCRACGWRAMCRNCAINLTHYRDTARLLCHYCGHEEEPPALCSECHMGGVLFEGVGTERVTHAARALFPTARVARMDGETLRRRGAAETMFRALKEHEIDVLVGTQVVAKGLDVPAISLVGVISADTALLVPDFRSAERTFQLICQVAGRAGRGHAPGRVLIQTHSPDYHAIVCAASHDQHGFAARELPEREALGYPPFGHLARVVAEAPVAEAAERAARAVRESLERTDGWPPPGVRLLGPAPCPIEVIKGQHRRHLLLRTDDAASLTALLPRIPRRAPGVTRLLVDRDPATLL